MADRENSTDDPAANGRYRENNIFRNAKQRATATATAAAERVYAPMGSSDCNRIEPGERSARHFAAPSRHAAQMSYVIRGYSPVCVPRSIGLQLSTGELSVPSLWQQS